MGVACIVFSFNLIRALKDSPTEVMSSLAVGDLPPSRMSINQRDSELSHRNTIDDADIRGSSNLDYKTFRDGNIIHSHRLTTTSIGSEIDIERQLPDQNGQENGFFSVFRTFYSYVRLW